MYDRYKKRFRSARSDERLRRQIATEAAKRLRDHGSDGARPGDIPAEHFASAKRMAVSVLGQTVRPVDLPSDAEVREQLISLLRSGRSEKEPIVEGEVREATPGQSTSMADHLDRYTIYRLRLEPLQGLKLNPRYHPEGDALYHSLQVFDRASESHPFDEEFLLAALLHDVGRAIDGDNLAASGLEALGSTIGERTAWLIEHLADVLPKVDRAAGLRARAAVKGHAYFEDLCQLAEADLAGRVAGAPARSLDEALEYLRRLEREEYPESDSGSGD